MFVQNLNSSVFVITDSQPPISGILSLTALAAGVLEMLQTESPCSKNPIEHFPTRAINIFSSNDPCSKWYEDHNKHDYKLYSKNAVDNACKP